METRTITTDMASNDNHGIPKVIHYCWFGRNPLPELAQKCIDSWKKYLPECEIKEWNEDNFDISINKYTEQAYESKKYAFVSDFARLWILQREGGLYFDVDVELIKPMDDILRAGAFMGCEGKDGSRVNPGLGAAATPRMRVYGDLIKSYENDSFIEANGKFNTVTIVDRATDILKKHGLQDVNEIQQIAGLTIYPSDFFAPKSFDTGKLNITENTRSIHWYDASWLPWHKKMYQPLKHMLPDWFRSIIQKKTASKRLLDNKKRVGIVTFQHNNYGTRLQNYALIVAIKSLDFTPVSVISKHKKESTFESIRKIQSVIFPFGEKSARWKDARLKSRIFRRFVKQEINPIFVSRTNLTSFGRSLHMAIAGSDQIWNPDHLGRYRHDMYIYFLKFVQKEKRIAYAPSFGKKSIPADLAEMYAEGVNGFNMVSVREYDGQKIIRDLGVEQVEIMPDPTFLLNVDEWNNLTKKFYSTYAEKKYIVVYFLSNQDEELLRSISEYANTNRLTIVDIAGNTHKNGQITPAPDEFLAVIQNASCVFTDSFHGVVFSIIFNTPFVVYDRVDRDQSSRIETLLRTYKLELAYKSSPDSWKDIISHEDFSGVKDIMKEKREIGLSYLKNALNSVDEGRGDNGKNK